MSNVTDYPWLLEEIDGRLYVLGAMNDEGLSQYVCEVEMELDETPANARMLQKAPEMLEALNALAYAYGKKKGPFVLAGALLKEDAIRTAWKMAMKVLAEVEDE